MFDRNGDVVTYPLISSIFRMRCHLLANQIESNN